MSTPSPVQESSPRRILLATRNAGKLREIRQVLAQMPVEVLAVDEVGAYPEPHEDGATFAENARLKACYYARMTGQWCLADDSGLEVDALGGQPGVYSARYAADACPPGSPRETIDAANNAKLLAALTSVPDDRRTARFVCCLALCDGQRVLIETRDTVEGRIGHEAHGDNGFGYDPLFYIPPEGCTTAELPSHRKNEISHRGKALRQFAQRLQEYLR